MKNIALMPVLVKEFRSLLRGSRAALMLTLYIGLSLIAMRLVYNAVAGEVDAGPPIFNAQIGQAIFIGLALAVQALTIFLAPATTVNSISSEHEHRTFDLMLATPVSATQVLLGKLITALAFVALLLLAVLPLFSVVVLFGGVALGDIGRVLLTVLISAVTGCVLGLFCSIVTRQTYSATLLCYAILIAVTGGSLFAANLWSITHSMLPAPPQYVIVNPLSAIASALSGVQPPELVVPNTLQPLVLLSLLTQGTVNIVAGERSSLPTYRTTWVVYGAVSLLVFWLCLHLVQPRRRWRWDRTDVVMLGVTLVYTFAVWVSRAWWLQGLMVPA